MGCVAGQFSPISLEEDKMYENFWRTYLINLQKYNCTFFPLVSAQKQIYINIIDITADLSLQAGICADVFFYISG